MTLDHGEVRFSSVRNIIDIVLQILTFSLVEILVSDISLVYQGLHIYALIVVGYSPWFLVDHTTLFSDLFLLIQIVSADPIPSFHFFFASSSRGGHLPGIFVFIRTRNSDFKEDCCWSRSGPQRQASRSQF